MYFLGEGCEENIVEARNWFEQAGEGGHASAQLNAGLMFDLGTPEYDVSKARQWYKSAAKQGVDQARNNLEALDYGSSGGGTSTLSARPIRDTKLDLHCDNVHGGGRFGSGRTNASKRLRETIDARRSELLPPKSLLIPGTTECTCATFTSCEHCSDAKQKAAEESCRQLRVLFYASTNDIMTMEHSDADILNLIEKFVHVPDARKDILQREWEENQMPRRRF